MSNIASFSAIESGTAATNLCRASVVSNNFTKIAAALNSNNANDENYGESSVKSQYIGTQAIISDHISDSQIASYHMVDGAIRHQKLNFASSDGGVRLLQYGTDQQANGLAVARYSQTMYWPSAAVGPQDENVTQNFTAAIDGDPGFTATPVLFGEPILVVTNFTTWVIGANQAANMMADVIAIDSASAEFRFRLLQPLAATNTFFATVNFAAIGEVVVTT